MTTDEATDPLRDLARSVVARARPGESVEAFAVREVSTGIATFDGTVESLSSAESRGVGIRLIVDGRQGYAHTADVTEAGLAEAFAAARENATVATPDEANVLPGVGPIPDLDGLADARLRSTPVAERIDVALAVEEAARSTDARVRGTERARYGDTHQQAALVSTAGLDLVQERTDAYAYANVIAVAGDEQQTGMGLTLGRGPADLDPIAAGREGATRALRMLGASKPRSRRAPVVLDPFVTAQVLGILGQALSAEAVLKGRSLFAGRMGEQVAAAGLSLVDDGLITGAPGTAAWDAEGVAHERTSLIDDGVLTSYLHNSWTAARTGGGARSTGNASRAGFASSPGLSPTNLHLSSGGASAADVIGRVDDGVYVQEVMGLHSGANPVSGEVSVSFSGLEIRDGALGGPLREAVVSSTLIDILTAIEAVADDRRFIPFGGSLGGATVLVAEMSISGS